ncbi:MAG TPA: recombination mediator RecR [Candidatus Wunengus sp. YC60]|uniref:recombination mediator RecR n=1 Tax=Candidatus Wunengus sp. YC60 TaxID=3367697 RepID=UPI004027DF56
MNAYPQSVIKLINEFGKMPGIGQKTAERLACHILKLPGEEAMQLAYAIRDVKKLIKACTVCFNVSEDDPCHICSNIHRDRSVICVVEQLADLLIIEKTGKYRGLYHVLGGHISPLEDITPESLTIEKLLQRVKGDHVKEVIVATNLNMEGDATAMYIHKQLQSSGIRVTRLARGLPTGSYLEYANTAIVADAISGRNEMLGV